MYADTVTGSMRRAIDETNRRRSLQMKFNKEHNIVPKTIKKDIREIIESVKAVEYEKSERNQEDYSLILADLENEMLAAAETLEFEKAAELRDRIKQIKKEMKENG